MALTLLEAAKMPGTTQSSAVVMSEFAATTPILEALPFETHQALAVSQLRESDLPDSDFRAINANYTATDGRLEWIHDPMVPLGSLSKVDSHIVRADPGVRQRQLAMHLKAVAHDFAYYFIKGNSTTDATQFDGLQTRVGTGDQAISAGNTSGGDPLSLAALDEVIDAVDNPTHIITSKAVRRRFTAAARNQSVGGHIEFTLDSMGNRITRYADLPILIADPNGIDLSPLGFTEAAAGGGSTATSLYVVSLGDNGVSGVQQNNPDAEDLGLLQAEPKWAYRIDWSCGIAIRTSRSVARLYGISDAAITA